MVWRRGSETSQMRKPHAPFRLSLRVSGMVSCSPGLGSVCLGLGLKTEKEIFGEVACDRSFLYRKPSPLLTDLLPLLLFVQNSG